MILPEGTDIFLRCFAQAFIAIALKNKPGAFFAARLFQGGEGEEKGDPKLDILPIWLFGGTHEACANNVWAKSDAEERDKLLALLHSKSLQLIHGCPRNQPVEGIDTKCLELALLVGGEDEGAPKA